MRTLALAAAAVAAAAGAGAGAGLAARPLPWTSGACKALGGPLCTHPFSVAGAGYQRLSGAYSPDSRDVTDALLAMVVGMSGVIAVCRRPPHSVRL
jgi:hypothetical protein